MTHTISPSSCNLPKILGFTPEFNGYFEALIHGKDLVNKCVKENGGIITFTFTFSDQEKVKHDKHVHNGGKTSKNGGNTTIKQHGSPDTQKHKKKSPFRRRRDRARLHKFLEKKKHQRQLRSAQPESLTLPQCAPPREQSIQVSHSQPLVLATSPPPELPTESSGDDSWITVSEVELPAKDPSDPVAPLQESTKPVEPMPEPNQDIPSKPQANSFTQSPCRCPFCTPVVLTMNPDELYEECYYCHLSRCEAPNGLKPCSRCLSSAYCSKECQKHDWKKGDHKSMCSEQLGARVREIRQNIMDNKQRALEKQRIYCPRASGPVVT